MPARLHRLFLCSGVLLCATSLSAGTAFARRHTPQWTAPANAPGSEPAALPAEAPPALNADAAPSLSLQPFLESHLDKLLAPLGTAAFAQSELIAGMRASYAKALLAAPDARKPAYQLTLAVCDVLTEAIAERQKAVAAISHVYDVRSSEAIQPRGGRQAVKDTDKDESFFYNSQKNNWLQNATAFRQRVVGLLQRERAAETQAGGPWVSPPAPPPAGMPPPSAVSSSSSTAAATPGSTPSVSVPPPEIDPVVGSWAWQNHGPLKLEADHSISGSRHGTWQYTCTTDAGRNYEMHWAHKGWVDYVVLSADGKILDGKSNEGKHVTANR